MRRFLAIAIIIVLMLVSGCRATETVSDNRITVYTSFNAMYQFAKSIAGDKAEVICLMPGGAEPHDWEPTAADIVKIEKADVFIYSDDNMETWAEKVLSSVENENLAVVEASEGVVPLEIHSHSHGSEASEHKHSGADPHVWLNPENVVLQMQNIAKSLCEKDSANADYYNTNLSVMTDKLNELDAKYRELLGNADNKQIIVSHEAYGYLCDAYGLEQVGIRGVAAESEPSPAQMAEIVDFAKENNIKYVFAENSEDTKLAETVAEEIGGEVLVLNPFESSNEDYFTVMENNLVALEKALGSGE